jgi:hypothetical protein
LTASILSLRSIKQGLHQRLPNEEEFWTFQVRMPRRTQKTGGLLQKRRGYLTHAGLAAMAVAASLGPA